MIRSRLPCVALPMLALLLTSCQPGVKANAEDAKPPTPVHAVAVRLFTPQSGERYSASLIPARQLTLSFRVAGFVESILAAGTSNPAGWKRAI